MASSPFLEDFDTLLNGILTDYQNQFPDADVSKGTLIFIKSACLASARWGLSKKIDWAAKQIFPDTADTNNMYHHAWVHGLSQNPGESDSAYLARLLNDIQQPPAGGNTNDFEQWALGVAGVGKAYCIPLGQGYGTVDVVILADPTLNGGSEAPSAALLAAVYAYIDSVRPVTAKWFRVLAATIITQNVTMSTNGNCNVAQTASDITNYINSLIPGQALNLTQLSAIAIKNGATDATITVPVANIVPTAYQVLRAGVISVT